MLRETVTNVRVDVSEGLAWIPKVEVVLPALQVPVQLLHQAGAMESASQEDSPRRAIGSINVPDEHG
jgi:hypothetical protein